MKIIDLVKPEIKQENPIELVACVQYHKIKLSDASEEFYFCTSNYVDHLNYITEIKRVGTIELEGEKYYDIILTLSRNNKTALFLGHWNSGKVNV